jgi:GAF domain-containing protein
MDAHVTPAGPSPDLDPLHPVRLSARTEAARLAALESLRLLDTPAEPAFDAIVAEAARRFGTPVALISLLDAERQWFKARQGLDAQETPRDVAFCRYTIRGPEVMTVPDATEDARFARNPLVTGATGIRFYAGAPIAAPDGSRIGTLCLIDRVSRPDLTEEERQALAGFADAVSEEIARRAAAAELAPPVADRPVAPRAP